MDSETKAKVAIKKIPRAFDDVVDAKRILREITLLRQMEHENIVNIARSPRRRAPRSAACFKERPFFRR